MSKISTVMGAIKITDVGKIYPNGTRALGDVNIEINDGEWTASSLCDFTHCVE